MGKNFAPKGKQCRREGVAIHPKGIKVLARRPFPPGQHGSENRNKLSEYGKQLREKQKAKRIYGVLEKQFSRYFERALKKEGNTGIILAQLLETRLDNVVYRSGFASSRPQARQIVSHGHVLVNGKKLNIASYTVEIGDIISIKPSAQASPLYTRVKEMKEPPSLGWLSVNLNDMSAKLLSVPAEAELEPLFDPRLVVEFYSR